MMGQKGVSAVIITIILGVVVLFVGVFMLASIEPLFDLDTCAYSSYTGSPEISLNGSANASLIQNYSVTAIASGSCNLTTQVENISATTGTINIYSPTGTLLGSITTIPATTSLTQTTGVTSSTGTYSANYTYLNGDGFVNITTTSYMYCCSSMVRDTSIAGRYFDPLTVTAATIFTILGLILIIIGLATAIGMLKGMV